MVANSTVSPCFQVWLIMCRLLVFIYSITNVWYIISVSYLVFTSIVLTLDFSNLDSSITVVCGIPAHVAQMHVNCVYNAPYLLFHMA